MEQTINKNFQWEENYEQIKPESLTPNVISLIGKQWMLVSAGDSQKFNTLTANWGGVGFMWNKPVVTTYIRDNRYTYEFLEQQDSFTLSFFPDSCKDALKICGTKSGRDSDKIAEAGLNPVLTSAGLIAYAEAEIVIECRKMFVQQIELENLLDSDRDTIIKAFYTQDPAKHQCYISEIISVWVKK